MLNPRRLTVVEGPRLASITSLWHPTTSKSHYFMENRDKPARGHLAMQAGMETLADIDHLLERAFALMHEYQTAAMRDPVGEQLPTLLQHLVDQLRAAFAAEEDALYRMGHVKFMHQRRLHQVLLEDIIRAVGRLRARDGTAWRESLHVLDGLVVYFFLEDLFARH